MVRQLVQQVIDDIALIMAEFPQPQQQTPVIEAYLAKRVNNNEPIIEDV